MDAFADPDAFRAVLTFLVAVEAGSFSAAARRLRVSQSTVSRHVASLEAAVGQPLFVRAGRRVTVTDVGAALSRPATEIREAVARFERIAAGKRRTASGVVRLATVDEIARGALAPAFARLRAKHPELVLEIVARIETASLERRDADLALRFTVPTNVDLVRKKAATVTYGVFGTRRMLREAQPPWIGFEGALSAIPEARWVAEHVAHERVVFRATSIDTHAEACVAGVGLALLPLSTARLHPSLVQHSAAIALTRTLWLVAHRDVLSAPHVRAVFRWAFEACASAAL